MSYFKLIIFIYLIVFQCFRVPGQPAWQAARSPLKTPWAAEVFPENVWPEYPRPDMVREQWMNLNGEWNFQLMEQKTERIAASGKILVPFPVESALSGIKRDVGPEHLMVYNRSFTLPKDWAGQRILLHFGAVDYEAELFVNTQRVGSHKGGYSPFFFDITEFLKKENNEQKITVQVTDPTEKGSQPTGNQRTNGKGHRPCSGIWQTVWLEPVPRTYIKSLRVEPDADKTRVLLRVELAGDDPSRTQVIARAYDGGKKMSESKGMGATPHLLRIRQNAKLWTLDEPFLYNLEITTTGKGPDKVRGYFGLRKIAVEKGENGEAVLLLNNEPIQLNGVLDQGQWPGGGYTAPSGPALRHDLETAKAMGFNLIRKVGKVEPPHWYHLCDQLGILVWQEMPSGKNMGKEAQTQFRFELKDMVDARFNHPSIVAWSPFGAERGKHQAEFYHEKLKEWDPDRLSIGENEGEGDLSASSTKGDILTGLGRLGLSVRGHEWPGDNEGTPKAESPGELLRKFEDGRRAIFPLLEKGRVSGAVFHQLTDVESQTDGLLTFDRKITKLDPGLVALANAGYLPPRPVRDLRVFPKKLLVELSTPMPGAKIEYTFDGLVPGAKWKIYTEPFYLKKTATVYAKATWPDGKSSRTREYVFTKKKPLKSAGAPKDLPEGFTLKIYEGGWREIPDLHTFQPAKTLTVNDLNLESVDLETDFAAVFEGWLEVEETDGYTFGISAFGNAKLYVGNQLTAEKNKTGYAYETSGDVPLKKGKHPIRLEFLNGKNIDPLSVWMEGKDGEKRAVK